MTENEDTSAIDRTTTEENEIVTATVSETVIETASASVTATAIAIMATRIVMANVVATIMMRSLEILVL